MSYSKPILPGSPKKAVAEHYGRELVRAMEKRRVSTRGLSSAMKVHNSSVAQWRAGVSLPSLEMALRMSEALQGWPALVDIVRAFRTRVCESPYCSQIFVDESGIANRRFHDPRCRGIMDKLREGSDVTTRATIAERRNLEYRMAVNTMCGNCEPEGLCRRVECPLRMVSPLPLAKESRHVGIAEAMPSWMTPDVVAARTSGFRAKGAA